MRLPFLLYPNPAVNTMHKEAVAFFAGFPPKIQWHTNPCRHGNPPGRSNILHRQFRVLSTHFLGLLKQNRYPLPRNLFNIGLLIHRLYQTTSKARSNYITLAPNHETFWESSNFSCSRALSIVNGLQRRAFWALEVSNEESAGRLAGQVNCEDNTLSIRPMSKPNASAIWAGKLESANPCGTTQMVNTS